MKYDFPMIIPIAMDRILNRWRKFLSRFKARWYSFWWGIEIGSGVRFEGEAIVRTRHKGDIKVGQGTVFNANPKSNLVGLINPTILDTLHGGKIEIGENSGLSSAVISSQSHVLIGNRVLVGGNVRIFDHDFHSLEPEFRGTANDLQHVRSKPIVIGDDCFIGTNSIILKGSEIGAGAIIAAGSIVSGLKAPPMALVKGNPAEIVVVVGGGQPIIATSKALQG